MEILSELGQFFTGLLAPLLDAIRENDIGAGLAFLVLLLGALVLIFAVWRFSRDSHLLNRAISVLEGVESESDFAERFQEINQDMQDVPVFGFAWSEFCETLIQPKRSREGSLVPAANTVRPQSYFNTVDLPIGPKFLTVWPNIFVGIGLTITFLGLIAALSEASTTMDQGDGAIEAQKAVQSLLNVAAAKFYASLVALFVSVILTLVLKLISTKTASKLALLNNRIEAGVRFLSQESLAARANELMDQQLEQLKTFNTDLAIKIGEQVSKAITPVLSDIQASNEQARVNLESGFTGLGDRVSDAMSGATQEAMQRVADSLEEVSKKLDSLGDILANSLSGFDEQLKVSLGKLSVALEETMSGVSAELNENLANMGPQIGQSLSAITEIMEALQENIATYASDGAENMGQAIGEATGAAGKVISDAGAEFSEAFRSATGNLISDLKNLALSLSELDQNLSELPGKLELVGSSLSTASTSITTASNQFTSSASGMKSVIEPLAQFAIENRQSLELLNEGLQTSSDAVQTAATDIKVSVTTLNDAVQERLSQMSRGDEALEKYIVGLNESTERVLASVLSFVNDVDKGFSSSIGQLQGSIDDLETVAEQLATSASRNTST